MNLLSIAWPKLYGPELCVNYGCPRLAPRVAINTQCPMRYQRYRAPRYCHLLQKSKYDIHEVKPVCWCELDSSPCGTPRGNQSETRPVYSVYYRSAWVGMIPVATKWLGDNRLDRVTQIGQSYPAREGNLYTSWEPRLRQHSKLCMDHKSNIIYDHADSWLQ